MTAQVAIVTGGADGIGRALCEQLAAKGAVVVVADINLEGAEQVAKSIREHGGRAEAVAVDVSRQTDVENLVNSTVAGHKRLDLIFNNAALAAVGELRDGNLEDFRRIVDVNLFGVIHGTMAAYRAMLRQGFGHIVNLASVVGLMPGPVLSAYSTTKWAIVGFSAAIRAEGAGLGVKVSVACPGLVRTNIAERNVYWKVRKEDHLRQIPWGWCIAPSQAAEAILRGVARNRSLIIFPLSGRVAWWAYRACPLLFEPWLQRVMKRFRRIRIKD